MSFFKDLKLIVTIRELMRASAQRVANQRLWDGCKTGDVTVVKEALNKGANVNGMYFFGEYTPHYMYSDESYHAYITPLILTATKASKAKDKGPYYQILSVLLQHPTIDLSRVAKDVMYGYKDSYTDFKSLDGVLTSPERFVVNSRRPRVSAHLYPISDEVVHFLTDIQKRQERAEYLARIDRSEERN